jgi:hypothetical protein
MLPPAEAPHPVAEALSAALGIEVPTIRVTMPHDMPQEEIQRRIETAFKCAAVVAMCDLLGALRPVTPMDEEARAVMLVKGVPLVGATQFQQMIGVQLALLRQEAEAAGVKFK